MSPAGIGGQDLSLKRENGSAKTADFPERPRWRQMNLAQSRVLKFDLDQLERVGGKLRPRLHANSASGFVSAPRPAFGDNLRNLAASLARFPRQSADHAFHILRGPVLAHLPFALEPRNA